MSASLVGSEMCIRDSAGIAWRSRCLSPERIADEGADWVLHLVGMGGAAGPPAFTEQAVAGGPAAC
eukprot:971882-Alexandrium_andersonii.AAC.1